MSRVLEGGRLTDLSVFTRRKPSCCTNMSQGSCCTREAHEVLPGDPTHQNQLAANTHGKTALTCLQGPWWFILSRYGGGKCARVWHWAGVCLSSALPISGVSWLVSRHLLQLILSTFIRNVRVLPLPSPPNTLHFQINFKSNLFNIELFLICIVTSS